MISPLPAGLAALAAAHGVATGYLDHADRQVPVGQDAVLAALAALGVDGTDPAAALAAAEQAPWDRLLPPSVVARAGGTVVLHGGPTESVVLHVELEDGGRLDLLVPEVVVDRRGDRVRREVPLDGVPLGWHRLVATSGVTNDSCVLAVVPDRLPTLSGRSWGWMVQLYSLRSTRSWAMGDYADLRTQLEASAADGAGLVLLNPLHAETPVAPINPSPYSPSSRRFRAALYLHVEDVPEHAAASDELRATIAALRPVTDPERIPRDPVWTAKLAALELLWPSHRGQALVAWRAAQGRPLEEFSTFCALAEVHGASWQQWPVELRRADTPQVAAAAVELADRVAFWCWVQLLVDEQVAGLGAAMAVGVVHDLAVGVDAGGADAWALQDALALGTTVGAPPDLFNQQGQDWGLPPWRPDRLAELGYQPLRDVVRGTLRHAGGLRIDHVMGLFRLWWVPAGSTAAGGTFVSYDADAMLGVVALEALRAGAVVIGEDLGTVEDRVRGSLDAAGVLGSAVLWFESEDGEPVEPARWRTATLATVTTHDLPTAAGFLAEEHVRVRHELGQLGVPLEQEQARARQERAALMAVLERTGLLAQVGGDPVLAMHAALAASPSRLVLAAYGDAVGDLRQPNLPGTVDQYPNWRLPVADGSGHPLGLEQLLAHPGVRRLTALLAEGVGGPSAPVR